MTIDFYSWPTPNGWKVAIALEEMGLPYTLHPVNIGAGEQHSAAFLQVSPNNKIPAITDSDGPDGTPVHVFESGAILLYLAEKTGRFGGDTPRARYRVLQWLMWQMGGLGPMAGQTHHFLKYAPDPIPYAQDRYVSETARLYGVLDQQLSQNAYVAGDSYSVADMAIWPWASLWAGQNQTLNDKPHLERWIDTVFERPAVRRGRALMMERRRDPVPDRYGAQLRS